MVYYILRRKNLINYHYTYLQSAQYNLWSGNINMAAKYTDKRDLQRDIALYTLDSLNNQLNILEVTEYE